MDDYKCVLCNNICENSEKEVSMKILPKMVMIPIFKYPGRYNRIFMCKKCGVKYKQFFNEANRKTKEAKKKHEKELIEIWEECLLTINFPTNNSDICQNTRI